MTNQQKAWLDAHPDYEIIGVGGGHIAYVEKGSLDGEGTFVPGKIPTVRDARENGPIGVGKKRLRDPSHPLNLRDPRSGQ